MRQGTFAIVVFSLLAIFVTCLAYCHGETPKPPRIFLAITEGYSMLPTARPGQHAVIEVVPFEQLREGDIVARRDIWRGNQVVGHRIVRRGGIIERGWITRGDNNQHDDLGLVTRKNYLGKVIFYTP